MKPPVRIFLTGGHGFLGQSLGALLRSTGGFSVTAPTREGLDVRMMPRLVDAIRAADPAILVHCAARVGGIGANVIRPATFFADNIRMGLSVLDAAVVTELPLVMIGTTCSYPAFSPVPFQEADLWNGAPEPTNAAYGVAKRALIAAQDAYRSEYGLEAVTLILANLYGPGDNYDVTQSHVVPALIRKVMTAKEKRERVIELWGDGSPTRDLLYVVDAARAIRHVIQAFAEHPDQAAALIDGSFFNVGTGLETSILDIVQAIAHIAGHHVEITVNADKPNGQSRRALDSSRFRKITRWEPRVSLTDGLSTTILDYAARMRGDGAVH